MQQRKYRKGFYSDSSTQSTDISDKKEEKELKQPKIPKEIEYDDYKTANISFAIGYGNFSSVPLQFEIGAYGLNAFYDAVFISSKPFHSFGVTYDALRNNPNHSIKLGFSLDANFRGRYEFLFGKPYSKYFVSANIMYGEYIPENVNPNQYQTLGNYFSPFSISIGKRISDF